jgi:hypothetical protein
MASTVNGRSGESDEAFARRLQEMEMGGISVFVNNERYVCLFL